MDKAFAFLSDKILPSIIPFLTGFFTAIFAEPIRRHLFKPNLELNFDNNDDFVTLTPEKVNTNNGIVEIKAYYIRIKVTNTKNVIAKDCKAYLVNIEILDGNGKFKPTIYCDSLPLSWSCQNSGEQYNGIDINKGMNQFCDIFATRHLSSKAETMYPTMKNQFVGQDILYPQIKVTPYRYEEIFKDKGNFRFTVQVTSANADPKKIMLVLEWKGIWDKFTVRKA